MGGKEGRNQDVSGNQYHGKNPENDELEFADQHLTFSACWVEQLMLSQQNAAFISKEIKGNLY